MIHKILVIDDAPEALELMKSMLEGAGHDVMVAKSGEEGLVQAKTRNPSLVVLDVLMPGMNGFLFMKEMKRETATKDIPILVVTARAQMEDSFRAIGIDSFLSKPLDADKFLAEANRLIKRDEASREISEDQRQAENRREKILAEIDFGDEDFSATLANKALIYGHDSQVLVEMEKYLKSKDCHVVVIKEIEHILPVVDKLEPNLILLQLARDAEVPVDDIVFSVTTFVQKKAREFDMDFDNVEIVLFKVEEEIAGVDSIGEEVADTENILQRCYDCWDVRYLGMYNPVSFQIKIKKYLL
ncbi:MAG: response regulator [Candidatus Omnitrophica bacterium]|nr:response regulator [Candidatus Omnitrophota bacterium]